MSCFEMYPTIITPFVSDGSVDYTGLESLVELFARVGCEGVFAVCQSSEMFFLSDDEKMELAEKTLRFCRERGLLCIVSGHTQDGLDAQIEYLKRIETLKPDAIILVSNRFAKENESDTIALDNMRRVISALKRETALGMYECPYPYKRPLTSALLEAMVSDGRFTIIKDTCCEIETIRKRLELLSGSGIRLFNANTATLLESVKAGAAGYSGIQLNIMPEFFTILRNAYNSGETARAKAVSRYLEFTSVIECQNYPANAKYCMMKRGLIDNSLVRNGKPPLTESQRKELDAMLECNLHAYYNLLPHAAPQLLARYDTAFPECHASTVLPLADGRVLVAYFAGSHEGADDVGIWLSVRKNEVWSAPRRIAKVDQTAHWNPVLFESSDGIRLLFKVGKTIEHWQSYTMFSCDGGETWSVPERLNADNPAGGPVRNKPLVLSDGRMLAPNSDEVPGKWSPRIDESLDGGKTFHRLGTIAIERSNTASPNYMSGLGAIQPTLWESEPGNVHALLRTNCGLIYRSDSADGGKTWCEAYPTALPNNNSGIDAVKVDGAIYLAMNPISSPKGYRTPLVVMVSRDNGNTFANFTVLANDLIDDSHDGYSQFAYPAITAMDHQLYISYTHQRKSIAFCQIDLTKMH